jgi:hypothetical protein
MWKLNIENITIPPQKIVLSGGLSLDGLLGGRGECYRLLVLSAGYIDITDCSKTDGVEYLYDIYFNEVRFQKMKAADVDLTINITINNDGSFCIEQNQNPMIGHVGSYPIINETDIERFNWMFHENYIPYQKIPDSPGKTTEQIKEAGRQYFPFTEYSFQLSMALYDWTTADFTRIDFFTIFAYSRVIKKPLDLNSIAQAIWTADWPPYTPQDVYYMNSFMMKPAKSLEDVKNQLDEKASILRINNLSELNIIEASLKSMPRTSIIKIPKLYSGQVAISNLGTEHFATYFEEFPNNADSNKPLEMALTEALDTFIKTGNTLTLKSPMSYTDSLKDAMHYSNGIVLIASPKKGAVHWEEATYITPMSDGPEKIEYLFHPNTKFLIENIEAQNQDGKEVTVISLQVI